MIRVLLAAALAASLAPAAASAQARQTPVDAGRGQCFFITQMQGNRALDAHTELLRVNIHDIYALEFANGCPELTFPDPVLILTPFGGNGLICHAIDLDVKVGQNGGAGDIPVPCIPTGLRKLTPAEVSAIPKKKLP